MFYNNKICNKFYKIINLNNSEGRATFAKSFGFTLAEVLITLAIIGVVAAMTIPTLVNKTNDAEMITAWKKAYTTISQAYIQIINDDPLEFSSNTEVQEAFKPYFKVIKSCDTAAGDDCWHSAGKIKTQALSDGTTYDFDDFSNYPGFVTSDGMKIICHADAGYNMGWIMVDVNGDKKPNTAGKDVFGLRLIPTKAFPFGSEANGGGFGNCNPVTIATTPSLTGLGCSTYYLLNKG